MNSFQTSPNRRQTGSLKWDQHPELAPYWVADMDFPSPDCVLRALRDRVEHGVFGYSYPPEDMNNTLIQYMKEHHHANIQADWIEHIGGCVPALSLVVRALCQPEDAVMTCTPVYPPIRVVHHDAKCSIIEVPHIQQNGTWSFDWEAMEAAITPAVKLFILCNPQNPLGRVFREDEIIQLAQFCQKHEIILCSDEIHCDLILDTHAKHYSAISLPSQYHDKLIIISAPSKTYNIAGIGYSFMLIPNTALHAQLNTARGHSLPGLNCFAYIAAESAYKQGEAWRQDLLSHLRYNLNVCKQFLSGRIPQIIIPDVQATYLIWMNCSALNLPDPQTFFKEQARVYLNSGKPFGNPQCVRFNFATTTEYMLEGLEKMATAIQKHHA